MKSLTKAEEQVMMVLWKLKKAFVREIIEQLPKPKPAYNTISTIVRILETKGFVAHQAFGKSHQYYPLVTKELYRKNRMKRLLKGYFDNSFSELISFFAKEKELDVKEMDELIQLLQELKKKKQ